MATVLAQGCTLKVGDGASPEVFNAIGQVTAINGPSGAAPIIDVSNLSSTYREKRTGLPDNGDVTATVQYDPADTGQTRVETLRAGSLSGNFQIVLSNSPATTWSFAGYVSEFSKTIGIDEVVEASITVNIDGAIT